MVQSTINIDPSAHAAGKLYDPINLYKTTGSVTMCESERTSVAFNSPSEIANANAAPVAIADLMSGSSIRLKVRLTVAPSVIEAFRYELGIPRY